MTAKRITKKLTKVFAYILGGLIVLLVGFHFWFVNHAEEMIENLVNEQSNGKLHLQVKKFKFNWFSRKMELQQAVFYSTDTIDASTAYRFKVDKLKIQVKKILPVIFEKKFYIDSIHVINPDISVTRLRSPKDTSAVADSSLSIPQEMGRIYHSIQDALQVLKVDRFQIDNGTFSLINKTDPTERPIVISRLYFHLDNLQVDSTKSDGQNKILFSDDVSLHTTNQDILFPDGRHRLSFSNFRINIRSRLAEFDSCTIIATKGDSANTSFRIFFDKLKMTNIDFDTLYHTEVIKADSVYCINPRFRLDVDLQERTGPVQPPKLDELIQQLTGNMQLAFVVVQNGSFDINTMRAGRPSSFTSDHNNFELQGLRIQENAPRPLTVERFAMAIRNYENFLRDSAFAIQFDSILLNNNRISLSNFSYKEQRKNKIANSLSMPQFELQGLSWDNLIFAQQLNAQQVTLYRPVINYNLVNNRKGPKSKDVFDVLSTVGNILQLNNLNIRDGLVNLYLDNNISLRLEGTTMSVSAKQLVGSRQLASVQRSVSELNFKKGILKTPNWSAELENVNFNGKKNQLNAATVRIIDKKLTLNAKNVTINSMILPDKNQLALIKGIHWQSADLHFLSLPGSGTSGSTNGGFTFEDIRGTNTKVSANTGDLKMSVQLNSISADKIRARKGQPLELTGFVANGNNLNVTSNDLRLSVASLNLGDKQSSSLKNISYSSHNTHDSILLEIPSMTLVPDINALMKGHINADAVKIFQPFIKINLLTASSSSQATAKKSGLQDLHMGSVVIQQPIVSFLNTTEKGNTLLEWQGKVNANTFEVTNLKMINTVPNSISADQLRFTMDHFLYTTANGKKFDAGDGQLIAQINQLAVSKNELDAWDWQGIVKSLVAKNFVIDSLGKKGGTLTISSAKLNDLSISSSLLLNPREMVNRNTRFNLQEITGSYHNESDQFNWYNAGYDKMTRHFSVDSFSYHPTLDRDDFLKKRVYQSDYITGRTGSVSIGPFDIARYNKDTILEMGVVTVNDGYLSSYRDKRQPRQAGDVRLLPAGLLKKISTRLIADTMIIKNAWVDYEEVNEKTNTAGTISIARLNGQITDLRNFDLAEGDSLTIKANGYLQDTMLIKLQLREAYTDSLGGFLLTGQMGPADITKLNPILISLASAELKSGILDTMSMRVVGREQLAFGEMKMFYHDLKVKITKPGNKRTLLTGLTTFLANTLIKNENKHRTGTIFFVRIRDRSAINYLVKIALSGMTSSMGIKRNKKLVKKYEKEIKARKLPPIVLD
ncbi:MAG: hypothetical protein ABIR18_14500 [Chitinophagaceae bacterium]